MAQFDEFGRQLCDPRPVEVPTELRRPLSLHEEIKRFVRMEMSKAAADQAAETFEEADDFDCGDDPDVTPGSAYELDDLAVVGPAAEPPPPANPPAKPPEGAKEGAGEAAGGASAPVPTPLPTPPGKAS